MKTYTFHVSLAGVGDVWRTLELRADQTLEDLHHAIQDAYGWDEEHLYSFFMNNKAWDPQSEYTLPEEALYEGMEEVYDGDDGEEAGEAFSLDEWRAMSKQEQDALADEFTRETGLPISFFHDMIEELQRMDENPELYGEEDFNDVRTTTLDSLKLRKNQVFMYLFDYGDEHRFSVRVDNIDTAADPALNYPRVAQSVGESPPQYTGWDDDDWEEGLIDGDEDTT